jgi:hypothetical protein
MQIDGLKTLYSNMQRQGIDRYRFCFKHGRTRFDVFFFTDREPFVLLFGVHGQNISFEIEVQTGFRIEAKLDKETYGKLCSVLGLVYDPHNHFSPATFFETFNRHIPTYVNHDHIVRPEELIQYCRNVEEPNKNVVLRLARQHFKRSICDDRKPQKDKAVARRTFLQHLQGKKYQFMLD